MPQYERLVYVEMGCSREKINEKLVEYIDCYEDFEGRDMIVFKCPECKENHTSLRFG